jgi:C1A family cysteine protease
MAKSLLHSRSQAIISNLNTTDITDLINGTEALVSECSVDIAQLGWGKGIFDFWRKTNSESLYKNAKEKIEYYSKYRKIQPTEIEKYKKYALKSGIEFNSIQAFIQTNTNQGNLSAVNEKKQCGTSVDLRSDVLGPVRDQDSIGWCYAFAASELLTYKLKQKVSAADLAINYNHTWYNNILNKVFDGEQNFEGGWEDSAIKATIKKGGACLERNLRSEDNGFASLKKTLTEIDTIKKNSKLSPVVSCSAAPRAMFPYIATNDFVSIIENSNKTDFMSLLSDKSCYPRINLNNVKVKYSMAILESGRNKLCNEIDKQLDNKNIAAIGYNSEALYNIDAKVGIANHASVVVGRRFNSTKGECEYLIRNSWGRGCNQYDGRLNCEEGHIWMPKSVLVKGLQDVTYLE